MYSAAIAVQCQRTHTFFAAACGGCRTSVVGSAAAQEMLAAGLSVMPTSWCGRERGDWHGSFNKQGLMGFVSASRRT
jgi:hypothetical protein